MTIKTIAGILLLERLVSATFIVLVLRRQLELFKLPIEKQLHYFRVTLFCLSLAIFVGNFIPVLIDSLTLFADLHGRANPSNIGIAYAVSNATTAILAAIFVWALYRMAALGDLPVTLKHIFRGPDRRKKQRRKADRR